MARPPGEEAPGKVWLTIGVLWYLVFFGVVLANFATATSGWGRGFALILLGMGVVGSVRSWREYQRRNNPEPLPSMHRQREVDDSTL
jgi:hypothetical protein